MDATPHVRKVMREFVYFEPQPMIGKVIELVPRTNNQGHLTATPSDWVTASRGLPRSLENRILSESFATMIACWLT